MPIPAEWNLSGKAAIITADSRGWTPYLAAALAEAGADVAIAGAEDSDMPRGRRGRGARGPQSARRSHGRD